MNSIALITHPAYAVNFDQFAPHDQNNQEIAALHQRVYGVAISTLTLLKLLIVSLGASTYITLSHSGVSFKHIVLGYHGDLGDFRPPADIYLAVFRLAFWVLGMARCLMITTYRLFMEKAGSGTDTYLRSFAEDQINIEHIQTPDISIDVSDVPPEVTVDDLAVFFGKINFTDANAPGYMAPSSRQEDQTTYPVDELKGSLAKFIENVKTRTAFLGTPPSYDTPRLLKFYQQIENVVRLFIHQSNQDLANFTAQYGINPALYDAATMRKYNDLLETIARGALDLAIAGKHCGARYMGDVMDLYYDLRGSDPSNQGTLQACLISLLAHKRLEIARAQIATHLGNDTHKFSLYMQHMGGPLALPGTDGIIEHLANTFDRDDYMSKFFAIYTSNYIIDAIAEEIRKSNTFRGKIIDWCRDQAQDWNQATYQEPQEAAVAAANLALQGADAVAFESEEPRLRLFIDFIGQIRENIPRLQAENLMPPEPPPDPASVANQRANGEAPSPPPPPEEKLPPLSDASSDADWAHFINALFSLESTRNWCNQTFPQCVYPLNASSLEKAQMQRARLVQIETFKQACSESSLKSALMDLVLHNTPMPASFWPKVVAAGNLRAKVNNLQGALSNLVALPEDTLRRMISGACSVQVAIKARLDLDRQDEFANALGLEDLDKFGLQTNLDVPNKLHKEASAALMEWWTVSQGIFLPQPQLVGA